MIRRIIKQGKNTLTITLPSKWVKMLSLKSGDEIDLSERENGLFISTSKKNENKRTEFNITGKDILTIWKYFMAVYREGYDEVLIKFDPKIKLEYPYKWTRHIQQNLKHRTQKKTILESTQGFVSRFIGFEIVESGEDYVLVKEMGECTSKEFDNSLRRIFLLIQQMAEEILEAIKTNNPKMLQHSHDIDNSIDRFHDYCIRILNKTLEKEPRKISALSSIIYFLELVGDEFKNISIHLTRDFKGGKLKSLEKIAELIKEQIDLYYELFYRFDEDKLNKIVEIEKKEHDVVSDVYGKIKEKEVEEVLHHLGIIVRDINTLVELRIELEF